MIPRANINAWRKKAPWPDSAQVEQDLVLSRALVEMYQRPEIARGLAFRGGTALHKLFLQPPSRYSEDIDVVQRDPGPIGGLVNALRDALDSWLGKPQWKQGEGRFVLFYRFETSFAPVVRAKLKAGVSLGEDVGGGGGRDGPLVPLLEKLEVPALLDAGANVVRNGQPPYFKHLQNSFSLAFGAALCEAFGAADGSVLERERALVLVVLESHRLILQAGEHRFADRTPYDVIV